MLLKQDQYTINGTPDGPMFLKILISAVYIDTRATTSHIRATLSSLDEHLAKYDNNITKFNDFVSTQLSGLRARGEDTQDLLVNLFKAY